MTEDAKPDHIDMGKIAATPIEFLPGPEESPGAPETRPHERVALVVRREGDVRVFVAASLFGDDETDVVKRCSMVAADDRPVGMPYINHEDHPMVPIDVVCRLLPTPVVARWAGITHGIIGCYFSLQEDAAKGPEPVVVPPQHPETCH